MKIEIMTKEELELFKTDLLHAIKEVLADNTSGTQHLSKPWYKAAEVRKLLGISSGKLQQLRIKGLLRSSKIGGVHYYRVEDIHAMFLQGSSTCKNPGDD